MLKGIAMTVKNNMAIGNVLSMTIAVSLLLSLIQILTDSITNSDGILYLQTASLIQNGAWHDATKLFNWLFYPYLIAKIAQLTSLPLDTSAYILNSCFTSLTCAYFILITNELGNKRKLTPLIAALIILTFPSLNEYRNMIIRDHGYWCFYMMSCLFFIKAYKTPTIRLLSFIIISSVLASLFRVEGVAFFLVLSFIILVKLLIYRTNNRPISFIVIFFIAISMLFFTTFLFDNIGGVGKIKQYNEIINNLISLNNYSEIKPLKSTVEYLNNLNPTGYSEEYAPVILIMTFIIILTVEIASTTGFFYILITASGAFISKFDLKTLPGKPLAILIFINIMVLCGFMANNFFLTGRYPLALAFILLLPLPLIIEKVFVAQKEKAFRQRYKLPISIVFLVFIIIAIDSLSSFGASKDYLKKAGHWVSVNGHFKNSKLFTNSPHVWFYSGRIGHKSIRSYNDDYATVIRKITQGKLENFNVIAIKINRKNRSADDELASALATKPTEIFKNERGDRVLIFKQQI